MLALHVLGGHVALLPREATSLAIWHAVEAGGGGEMFMVSDYIIYSRGEGTAFLFLQHQISSIESEGIPAEVWAECSHLLHDILHNFKILWQLDSAQRLGEWNVLSKTTDQHQFRPQDWFQDTKPWSLKPSSFARTKLRRRWNVFQSPIRWKITFPPERTVEVSQDWSPHAKIPEKHVLFPEKIKIKDKS